MLKLDLNPPKKTLRQFGWIALPGFGLFALVLWWRWSVPSWLSVGLLALGVWLAIEAFCSRAFDLPDLLLRPVYVVMMLVAIPVGYVVTNLLLLLIYALLFTPVAWLFKLRGSDPLQRAWDSGAKSYWHVRKGQREPASYFRLY